MWLCVCCPACRYYTPTILQLAGVPSQTALLLSLLPAATNALGTVVGESARVGPCPAVQLTRAGPASATAAVR